MKLAICLAAALLAGCSSMGSWSPRSWSPGSWTHGSWLDAVGRPATPPQAMSDDQAAALLQEAAQLRAQSDAVRVRLAQEADRRQRFRYYEDLRVLGDKLAPVERLLRDAGRPVRAAGLPPPAV
jgi:hypothetical protein